MEKKSKKSIIIGITGLLLVTLTLLGLTYAYYRTRIIGNEANTSVSVTSQKLEVTYQNESALVNVTGIEPGGDAIVKTFEVANTGNATATYSVWLEDMTNTFQRNQDLQFTLTKNGETVAGVGAEGGLYYLAVGTHQILIPSVSIDQDSTDIYELSIYYYNEEDIDQSEDMGSTLSFKINIQEETVTWDTATEGTLLYAIKNASDASTTLGNTEDDYGISNYYTGVVSNNFVNYSGMCWRIVRVQGDGTIKLALADDEHECDEEGYSADYVEGSASGMSGVVGNAVTYSSGSWDLRNGLENEIEVNSFKNSNVNNELKSWVKSSGLDTSKMIATDWCSDMSFEYLNDLKGNEYGYDSNGNQIWYGMEGFDELTETFGMMQSKAQIRYQNNTPTLKCNSKGIGESKAIRTKSQYATLTLDEEVFAGVDNNNSCTSADVVGTCYYLFANINDGGWYWIMTPAVGDAGALTNYTMTVDWGTESNGVYNFKPRIHENYAFIDYSWSSRPVIAIRSDVTITEGDNGTQSNPYEIG